jgi:hypothetical protein
MASTLVFRVAVTAGIEPAHGQILAALGMTRG